MSDTGFDQSLLAMFPESKSIRTPAVFGLLFVLVIFAGLISWSAVAPLASAVMASGTVVVKDSVKTIQHFEGGVVQAIYVHDGQDVVEGAPVLQLDSARQESTISALRPQLVLMAAQEARIRAELENRSEIAFPAEVSGVLLSDYGQILRDQRDHFDARRNELVFRLSGFENERDQDKAVIVGIAQQIQDHEVRLELALQDVAASVELARTHSGTNKAMRDAQGVAASLNGELAGLKARAVELQKRIEHSSIESRRALIAFRQADELELQQLTRDEQDIMLRLREASISLVRATIRAPVSGQVVNLAVHTVGGVIAAGAPIMEVVPTSQPLIVEAQVRPVDIDDVKVGSSVMIRAEGEGSQRLPTIAGRVISVSADRLNDRLRGTFYFLVQIEVDKAKMFAARGVELRPGISLEVMIAKRNKTAIAYLIGPLMSVLSHAMKD